MLHTRHVQHRASRLADCQISTLLGSMKCPLSSPKRPDFSVAALPEGLLGRAGVASICGRLNGQVGNRCGPASTYICSGIASLAGTLPRGDCSRAHQLELRGRHPRSADHRRLKPGLVSLFDLDLVTTISGADTVLSNLVYVLLGAALYQLVPLLAIRTDEP